MREFPQQFVLSPRLLPALLPPVDELDGDLPASEDLLAPPHHGHPAPPHLLQLDVLQLEVRPPGGVEQFRDLGLVLGVRHAGHGGPQVSQGHRQRGGGGGGLGHRSRAVVRAVTEHSEAVGLPLDEPLHYGETLRDVVPDSLPVPGSEPALLQAEHAASARLQAVPAHHGRAALQVLNPGLAGRLRDEGDGETGGGTEAALLVSQDAVVVARVSGLAPSDAQTRLAGVVQFYLSSSPREEEAAARAFPDDLRARAGLHPAGEETGLAHRDVDIVEVLHKHLTTLRLAVRPRQLVETLFADLESPG